MKKGKINFVVILGALLLPLTVQANSSWHWLTGARPYYVLPVAIVVTLLAEILAINYIPGIKKPLKVAAFVTLGNLLSFAAPYVLWLAEWIELFGADDIPYYYTYYFEYTPSYTVGLYYFLVTIFVEGPIVFLGLKKNAPSKKALILTTVAVNAATTVFVAVLERLLCRGAW